MSNVSTNWVAGDAGWISDESSFYGDEDMQAELEDRVEQFSPTEWRKALRTDVNAIKAHALQNGWTQDTDAWKKTAVLHNPGEGNTFCRQLSESVSEFVKRLPPRSTQGAPGGWIWIHDPYRPRDQKAVDYAAFVERGSEILSDLTAKREQLEAENPGKAKGAITRKFAPFREEGVKNIYRAATETGLVSGKWMLFPYVEDVNRIWTKVAEATADALLGPTAKVAAMNEDEGESEGRTAKPRLICVYTKDFNDKKDIEAVLKQLFRLGVAKEKVNIYYKADALTHLNLNSGNEWGISASLHASKESESRVKDGATKSFG